MVTSEKDNTEKVKLDLQFSNIYSDYKKYGRIHLDNYLYDINFKLNFFEWYKTQKFYTVNDEGLISIIFNLYEIKTEYTQYQTKTEREFKVILSTLYICILLFLYIDYKKNLPIAFIFLALAIFGTNTTRTKELFTKPDGLLFLLTFSVAYYILMLIRDENVAIGWTIVAYIFVLVPISKTIKSYFNYEGK